MAVSEREKERIKRQRARRRKKRNKNFLIFLTIIVLALTAFVVTVKICNPDFDFSTLIPQEKASQVVAFVKEDVLKQTTTTTAPSTTKPTTTQRPANTVDYDYIEFEDFALDTALLGNQMGNLLNKSQGAVTFSSSYVYYSIAGKGIYRFEPEGESNSKVKVDSFNFKYLNVLGDYLYAVDMDTNKLKKMPVSGGDMVNVSDDISFTYLYNDKLFYVGTDNSVGFIDTSSMERTSLYKANADKTVNIAGISLSRIFIVTHDTVSNYDEYITIALDKASDKGYFREDTRNNELINLQIECGFMYYYLKQNDGSYNLCRQKFGSEQIITLIEGCSITDSPVIYNNRLYYSAIDGDKVKARELNMNSNEQKTMVTVSDADSSGSLAVGYGYQYIFLIGTKSEFGDKTCKCSCIYTSSSKKNTLTFKDGSLKY